MVFWGLEVKPGQAVPFHTEAVPGRLHITQATLGTGTSSKKSVLQCVVGDNSPILLCSLLPDKIENCQLNLEFEEDGVVSFSTTGPRSIHLSGFIETDGQDMDGDDYESDSYGEDISESDSDAFSDDNSDDMSDDEFSDEDVLMYPPPVSNSGVVIEEIMDEEKPAAAPGKNRSNDSKKKGQPSGNGDNDASQEKIVAKHSSSVPVSESEDEDGFPVPESTQSKVQKQESKAGETVKSKSKDSKKKRSRDEISTRTEDISTDQQKREEKKTSDSALSSAGATDNNEQPKKKKKNAGKESKKTRNDEKTTAADDKLKSDTEITLVTDGDQSSDKKKRKNKKKKNNTEKAEEKAGLSEKLVEKETEAKATQVREFPNGLVIEELKMGRPDGKRASPGKQVSVVYIGKLKKNGSIFDSNVGRAPFKFRLGVGQVIKGWDVGVNGMRVGDKRRLTIPPAMGYGAQGAGHKIPPNSWLMFDVELVNVN